MQRPSQQIILLASAAIVFFVFFQVYTFKKELQDVQASVSVLVQYFASQKWESQLSVAFNFPTLFSYFSLISTIWKLKRLRAAISNASNKFLRNFFVRVVSGGEEEKKEPVTAPKNVPDEPKAVKTKFPKIYLNYTWQIRDRGWSHTAQL
jgi:hypothetical protein